MSAAERGRGLRCPSCGSQRLHPDTAGALVNTHYPDLPRQWMLWQCGECEAYFSIPPDTEAAGVTANLRPPPPSRDGQAARDPETDETI